MIKYIKNALWTSEVKVTYPIIAFAVRWQDQISYIQSHILFDTPAPQWTRWWIQLTVGYYHSLLSKQTTTVSLALRYEAQREVITWACRALRRIIFLPVYNYTCLRLITCVNLSRRPLCCFYWVYFKRRRAQREDGRSQLKNKLTLGVCVCAHGMCRLCSLQCHKSNQELIWVTAIILVSLQHTVKVSQGKFLSFFFLKKRQNPLIHAAFQNNMHNVCAPEMRESLKQGFLTVPG